MSNTLSPGQDGRRFADDIFICILLEENVWSSTQISLKFDPKGLIIDIPALIQIIAWHRPGDKPLSEPMMLSLRTHICVNRHKLQGYYTSTDAIIPVSTTSEETLEMNWTEDLTHWGQVTHICVDNLTIIGSDNGLSPDRRQAIIWTNAGILLIGPLGTNLSEILI